MSARNATCRVAGAVLLVCAVVLLGPPRPSRAAQPPPLTTPLGVVAADDPKASEIGAAVLARGGYAADAAVATAFALGVVNPTSSGIGGGGFAVVHDAATGDTRVYDFREVAPAAVGPDDYVVDGKVDPVLAQRGGLAVGVPGEVAGLHAIHRAHGTLSWRRVVTPAARLARDGFDAGWFLSWRAPVVLELLPADATYDRLRALIAPGGAAVTRGQRIVREALAEVLLAIAARGPDAFYQGEVAEDIVATAAGAGGQLALADLAGYQVIEREPLRGAWRGMEVRTMPLPSSGGIVLLEVLGILDALDARGVELAGLGAGSAAAFHLVAEVLKHGFADRSRLLGDTGGARAMGDAMLAPADLAAIAGRIELDRVQAHDSYGHPELAAGAVKDGGGTSHVCVIDRDGNAVALTSTVNGYFGSKLVAEGGFVLNNQIDDFSLETGVANLFGLIQDDANLVAPGKRPLSSMTPVLLFDGDRVVGCAGGSGGPYIISNVLQVLLGTFVFDLDVAEAVAAPRIHHQWLPDKLRLEPEIPTEVADALAKRGHVVAPLEQATAVQLIRVYPDGTMEAASDPRKNGARAAP
jgi:gamma-glutamyltranspeptidase/glutathione hydrolase